jgi:RHS repeat-associated protein
VGRFRFRANTGLGNEDFTYDPNGTRTSSDQFGTYTVNPANNQVSVMGPFSEGYDQQGNLISASAGGSIVASYGHDSLNRLNALVFSGQPTNYAYNALNQRVSKSGSTGSYNYVYSPDGTLWAETAQNSTSIGSDYIWLGGQPIGVIRNGALYYIHDDHLGRPETVTGASGGIVWQASNTAFDRAVSTDTFGPLNLGFPGQYFDAESGAYYNINRYYNGPMGQFMESDPIGLVGGLNTYSYVGANPISQTDSSGLQAAVGVPMGGYAPTGPYFSGGYGALPPEVLVSDAVNENIERQVTILETFGTALYIVTPISLVEARAGLGWSDRDLRKVSGSLRVRLPA